LKVEGAGGCVADWANTPSYNGPPLADLKKAKDAGTLSQFGIPDFSKEVKEQKAKDAKVKDAAAKAAKVKEAKAKAAKAAKEAEDEDDD
jgi:hypothetical protein